jgi:hypothetical protein
MKTRKGSAVGNMKACDVDDSTNGFYNTSGMIISSFKLSSICKIV